MLACLNLDTLPSRPSRFNWTERTKLRLKGRNDQLMVHAQIGGDERTHVGAVARLAQRGLLVDAGARNKLLQRASSWARLLSGAFTHA